MPTFSLSDSRSLSANGDFIQVLRGVLTRYLVEISRALGSTPIYRHDLHLVASQKGIS